MKRRFTLRTAAVLALLATAALAGCSDSHDAAVGDLVDAIEQVEQAMADIESREDAEAAVSDLTALAGQMRQAEERMEQLGTPAEEENRELVDRYRDRMAEAMAGISEQMFRLEERDAFEPLEPVFVVMGLAPDEPEAAPAADDE